MSRLINKWNDGIRNQAISIIRNLTTENGLSFDELGVLSSFLLIERIENSKLAHYEDLEEQGRLIELPCAVGDTVWQITRNFISEFKIKSFICDNEGFFFYWECISGIYTNILGFNSNKIGTDVFLTKEAAEAKLKEMEGVNE